MTLTVANKKIGFEGKIIRVEVMEMSDGRVFEKAIRSPGTRIIIYDEKEDKVLLSKEYRTEISDYDYRLPGGKVRDEIVEWDKIKDDPGVDDFIAQAAIKEVREEAGIKVNQIKLFKVVTSGGPTIDWTLYYFVTNDFELLDTQELEPGEDIQTEWVERSKIFEICLSGQIKESRSVATLLQYFYSIKK